jgi:serine/threonine-protein kinase
MGEVYAARHTTTLREVALKRIRLGPASPAESSGAENIRRFLLEARAATAIRHPNVVEVYDVFEDADGSPVMVMELLKGETFGAYRERVGALTLCEAAGILVPAAQALRIAHQKGIVHRDLKPDNVFLAETPSGRLTKVLDFGIAKVLDSAEIGSDTVAQPTRTGAILGTLHYMSYEQAMSEKQLDHRADIWALGVMLFEALTGRRPLLADNLGQMYASLLQQTVPSIRAILPDLPSDAGELIDRCLAKRQTDRLDDLGPLIDVLSKYTDPNAPGARSGGRVVEVSSPATVTGPAVSTSTPSPQKPRRPRATGTIAVIAVAALATAMGVGAFALSTRTQTQAPAVTESVPPFQTSPPAIAQLSLPSATASAAPLHDAPAAAPSKSGVPPLVRRSAASAALGLPGDAGTAVLHPNSKKGISETLPY